MPTGLQWSGGAAVALACLLSACGGGGSSPATPAGSATGPQAIQTPNPGGSAVATPGGTQVPTPAPAALASASVLAAYPLPAPGAPVPHPVFAGDGNLWYAPSAGTTLYSVSTSGVVTAHPSAYGGTGGAILGLVAARDGSLYYVLATGSPTAPNQIRHMTTAGEDALVAAPAKTAITAIAFNASGLAIDAASYVAPDGSLVALRPSGLVLNDAALPGTGLQPMALAVGKDKRTWMLVQSASGTAEIAATGGHGNFTTYPLDPQAGYPSLALGPYGSLYYPGTTAGSLARIDVLGGITKFTYARTGQIGDVERYGDTAVAFVAAPEAGGSGSTIGGFRVGSPLVSYRLQNIADAIEPGPDGNVYVFEHADATPATELVAKVAPPAALVPTPAPP